MRRPFLAALIAAASVAAAPAAAHAATPTLLPGSTFDNGDVADFDGGGKILTSPNGDITAVYGIDTTSGGHVDALRASRRINGVWSDPVTISGDGEDVGDVNAAVTKDSRVAVVWYDTAGSHTVRVRAIEPGSVQGWTDEQTVSDPTHSLGRFDVDASADGTLRIVFDQQDDNFDFRIYEADLAPESTTWTPTTAITPGGEQQHDPTVSSDADGNDVLEYVVHEPGSNRQIYAAFRPNGQPWGPRQSVTGIVPNAAVGMISDRASHMVMTWTTNNFDWHGARLDAAAGTLGTPLPIAANALASSVPTEDPWGTVHVGLTVMHGGGVYTGDDYQLAPDAPNWSPPVTIAATDGVSGLINYVRGPGRFYASLLGGVDQNTTFARVYSYTPAGFSLVGAVPEQAYGTTFLDADDQGNLTFATIVVPSGSPQIHIGFVDAAGPAISGLSVPQSATVGDTLAFSASPADRFSALGNTTWDFGDGTEATGTDTTHSYDTAGTYTLTVTSSDSLGFETTASSTVTVTAPPAAPVDEPDDTTPEQPKVLAPVIEARLSGKVITLTARVNLRSGKSCSGKATATTSFGNTTYRTTLKLAKVDGRCIGTGAIRLKKTPSARTRLRVTVSSKSIRTRTLTTKRG